MTRERADNHTDQTIHWFLDHSLATLRKEDRHLTEAQEVMSLHSSAVQHVVRRPVWTPHVLVLSLATVIASEAIAHFFLPSHAIT